VSIINDMELLFRDFLYVLNKSVVSLNNPICLPIPLSFDTLHPAAAFISRSARFGRRGALRVVARLHATGTLLCVCVFVCSVSFGQGPIGIECEQSIFAMVLKTRM
jgi:hypothetical protein